MKIIKIEKTTGKSRKDSLPDIDTDFQGSRRDEVKRYMEERFGEKHVVSIGTYSRLKLRSILKDFARVKGYSFDLVNEITKNIDDQVEGYEWGDIFKYALSDQKLYDFIQKNMDLINEIKQVINNPRTSSVHPSAVIIVPKQDKDGKDIDLYDLTPVKKIDGILVGEWEGKYTDLAGFLKEDILGIAQLDKFKAIVSLIKKNTGDDIDLYNLDFDDEEVFEAFAKGHNEDVFQFGSFGLKNYSKEVKPDSMEDLIAMNALYRPGPMESDYHKDFAAIKHGKKKTIYDFGLKEVTKNTHGLYVYQEQIMQATVTLAGFSLGEAEQLRTCIKKFDKKAMSLFEEKFILGAKENGCGEEKAKQIWERLLAFSGYGFNKCLSIDTEILAFNGKTFSIKELLNKDFSNIDFVSFFNGVRVKNKLRTIHKNGIQKLYKVKLKDGKEIKVTENHKLMMSDGSYKELKDLKMGDNLKIFNS